MVVVMPAVVMQQLHIVLQILMTLLYYILATQWLWQLVLIGKTGLHDSVGMRGEIFPPSIGLSGRKIGTYKQFNIGHLCI